MVRINIVVACYTNPERTTVYNNGNTAVTVETVGSVYQPRNGEPYSVDRRLSPGQSVTFQSGGGATGNVLTRQYIYNNDVGRAEGARVRAGGQTFTDTC